MCTLYTRVHVTLQLYIKMAFLFIVIFILNLTVVKGE